MSDAEIDIAMPENPEPGEQPEDPLEDEEYEGVDDPAGQQTNDDDDTEVPQASRPQGEKFVDAEGDLVHLTQEQLRQLQYEAIHGYDTMRKERKTKKKAAEAKDKQEKQVYAAVSKAINPSADDGWGVCFQ